MSSALGNVFNSSGSTKDKIKTFATNSVGLQADKSFSENAKDSFKTGLLTGGASMGGGSNFGGIADPAELNWFTTSKDMKEQAQFEQDQVVAGQAEATAQKTQADNLAMIADEERKRKLLGGGRASTILSTAMGSSGGRRYLGGA